MSKIVFKKEEMEMFKKLVHEGFFARDNPLSTEEEIAELPLFKSTITKIAKTLRLAHDNHLIELPKKEISNKRR